MAEEGHNTGPVQLAQLAAACREDEISNTWRQNEEGGNCCETPERQLRETAPISSADRSGPHNVHCMTAHGVAVRKKRDTRHPDCPLAMSKSLKTPSFGHGRQQMLPLLALQASCGSERNVHLRRAYSAVPSTRQLELIDYAEIKRCCYSEWPPLRHPPHLLKGTQGDMKRWAPNACRAAPVQQTLSNIASYGQKSVPSLRECATPLSNLKNACAAALCSHKVVELRCRGKQRRDQKMFFCLLMLAACLCSLLCLFLLRHKQANPLTQALMLYATQKGRALQQVRRMITPYKVEHFSLLNVPLLGRLFFRTVASWFSQAHVAARLNTGTAVSEGRSAMTVRSRLTGIKADTEAAGSAFLAHKVGSYVPPITVTQGPGEEKLVLEGDVGKKGYRTSGFPSIVPASVAARGDHPARVDAQDESPFHGALTPDEFRELLLAEGGWIYVPHRRHSLPIELPDTLPALPRPGGGRFLRRHHAPDTPPVLPWPIPAITAEQALRSGRQLLSAEAYREAASVLQHAVRDGHLTRAVRLHGQFLYPWKLFSDEEREALRLLADQVRWFPKWVKHHRRSQRVDKSVLDLHLPVVQPQFVDRYGGPGSPSMYLSQGIRFTWLGHAAALVNIDGLQVLLDPMFDHDLIGSYNEWLRSVVLYVNSLCGSLGGRHRQPPCSYDELPADIDVVVLTHNHQDHIMENDVETLCRRLSDRFKKLIWYVPEGVSTFLRQYGCASSSIFEFSWGERRTLSCHTRSGRRMCIDGVWKKERALVETYEITFCAGLHWSGRTASKTDHNASLWGGFAINGPRHKFFYAGDTAYWRPDFDEFRKIGDILGPFHLAALPIGAYEPNEDLRYQHVKPHETLRMFKDVKAEVAVGVHWGTLRLSAEEFFDPMLDLECALLGLAAEDCHRTYALRHRYKATEIFLRQFSSRQARQLNGSSQTPPASPTSHRKRKQGTQVESDLSSKSRKYTTEDGSPVNDGVDADHAGQENSTRGGRASGPSTEMKPDERSRARRISALKPSRRLSPTSAAENAEFENLVQKIQTLMLPMADSVSNASNFQRLLRSLKLQEAGILPNTRAWKDNLLKEGARFQTLFVGQSIQVESPESGDFIWMSRSSGLQHILDDAPDEHYTFTPMYLDAVGAPHPFAKPQSTEYIPPYEQISSPSTSQDFPKDKTPAVLM